MAVYLFNDAPHFRSFIGAAGNVSLDLEDLGPNILVAAENHIIPKIGDDLWNNLLDTFAAPNANNEALLPYVQRPLAMLSMYEYMNVGGFQVSGRGFHRVETDDLKTTFKYQENNYRDYMLHNGYEAIERLLKTLEANSANYTLWTGAPESKRNRAGFINYAAELRLLLSKRINRYVFETLWPILIEVETFAILPTIGEDFYNELKTAIEAKIITEDQQTIIYLIQRSIAHFGQEEAIRRHIVAMKGDAIVVQEKLEPQGLVRQGAPDGGKLRLVLRHHNEFANRHISKLKRYLDANRDTFSTYKAWIEAIETAEKEEQNDERGECGESLSTNESIIRL